MEIILISVSAILLIGVVAYVQMKKWERMGKRKMRKNSETVYENETVSETLPEYSEVTIESLSEKVEEKKETLEEMTSRLNSMVSQDKDKPFAKMSIPDVSEVPNEPIDDHKPELMDPVIMPGFSSTEEAAPKKPKAKRKPKTETEIGSETKPKRPYKKRAKKNEE